MTNRPFAPPGFWCADWPWCPAFRCQQPPEPIDVTPLNGDAYYVLNQLSGLQIDLDNNSTLAGSYVVQQPTSFTNLSQRWTFTSLPGGSWQISNASNGLCLASTACRRLAVRSRTAAVGGSQLPDACYVVAAALRGCIRRAVASPSRRQWLLHDREQRHRVVDRLAAGLRTCGNAPDPKRAFRRYHPEPAMAAPACFLPRRGQRIARETGGCPRRDGRALVEGCRPAAGRPSDFQEPRRQHGALEAQFRAALCECISTAVHRKRLLRGNGCAGSGPCQAREEPRHECRTDPAVRRRIFRQRPAGVGRRHRHPPIAVGPIRLCESRNPGLSPGGTYAGPGVHRQRSGYRFSRLAGQPYGSELSAALPRLQIAAIQAVKDAAADTIRSARRFPLR